MPVTAPTRKSIPIWLFLLLLAVAIASGIGVLWQARALREQSAQVAQRTRENLDLRRELDRLSRSPSTPAPAPAPNWVELAKRAKPAVVNLSTTRAQEETAPSPRSERSDRIGTRCTLSSDANVAIT